MRKYKTNATFKPNPISSVPYPLQYTEELRRSKEDYEKITRLLKVRKEQLGSEETEYEFLLKYFNIVFANQDYSIAETIAQDVQLDYNWNLYKTIYRFDKDFFELLTENTSFDSVIADIFLHQMPFPCFYVENKIKEGNAEYIGFYTLLRESQAGNKSKKELVIELIADNGEFAYSIMPLEEGNSHIFSELFGERHDYSEQDFENNINDDSMANLIKKAINVIAYLCTDKPDIVKVRTTPPAQNKNTKSKKKDTVTIGQVGHKLAREIRENKAKYIYEGEGPNHDGRGKGTPKSAHIRKAHYHSFWVGKRDSADRKLIVRLIAPMLINSNKSQPITTIRKVANPNKKKKAEQSNDQKK